MLDKVIFYFFAGIAVAGAVLTVTRRNAVHSAIFLITSLLATAGIFLQLRAEFLFIVQIILYCVGIMAIELILNAVNINLVAFSRSYGDVAGKDFALFIIADAAAEAAVGLGIIIAFFRNRETVLEDEMDLLKW